MKNRVVVSNRYIWLILTTTLLFVWPIATHAEWQDLELPAPLVPQLSSDNTTLNAGLPLIAVVDDPNPAMPLRRVPAPDGLIGLPEEAASANFSITYVANGGSDLWGETCYRFPSAAKTVFNAAANIWGHILKSSVPITIRACWANLGASSTLGYSGGGPLHRDFSGANRSRTWYAGSLANALHGSDLNTSSHDMHITYNSNFNWYYGTDGNPPSNKHDLLTVVLHEIGHGLNFSGSMQYAGGQARYGYDTGYPNIYDVFVRNGAGKSLITYTNPSIALGNALTSNNLWFHGAKAKAANGGTRVKIYAPSTWAGGSSYSHLDYNTFNNTQNQLMVYAISAGESIHDPGPVTKGLLKDLGWPVAKSGRPRSQHLPFLSILLLDDADGADDAYEENDTLATAWYPKRNWEQEWLSGISGTGIQADDDWYKIDVSGGDQRVQIDCRFTHADGDIDIELYDASDNLLYGSYGTTDNESIDYTDATEGVYYIRVYYDDKGNTYDLWWDDISPP